MTNFKVGLYSSLAIFICHYIFGALYTNVIDSSGIKWMNPVIMFFGIYWAYLCVSLAYIFLEKKTSLNKWLIAILLMLLSFLSIYAPFLIEGSFSKNFSWVSIVTLMLTVPILVYSVGYFDHILQNRPSNKK